MDAQDNRPASTSPSSTPNTDPLQQLAMLRSRAGERRTSGLEDATVARFAASDARLGRAIREAVALRDQLSDDLDALVRLDEDTAVVRVQQGFLNFYPQHAVNPYIPLSGRGPWVVTTHGAVLHDNGGYGMLGFGHGPDDVLDTMAHPHVMANIMTPSLSHRRFIDALRAEVGHARTDVPFDRFLCLNSGSESVTVAARISDIHAWSQVRPGGPREGQPIKFLALRGAFHGRTQRPAMLSHSTRPKYEAHLASFQSRDDLIIVPPNDVDALEAAFVAADEAGVYIESMFLEPVMGEGRPGHATSRAFYDAARRLTRAHGCLLVVDSIQAGLRATGALSIVDYPGFEDCDPPDMETWSKALNAGQYPLSVLGLSVKAAEVYQRGVYGNTMTGNPRAIEVACTVLERFTPALRANVRGMGRRFVEGLHALQADFPEIVVEVTGTGLLFCCELNPDRFKVVGTGGVEEFCRLHGLGVIHGGRNALRFTPNFDITVEEVDLVLAKLRWVFHQLS